MSSDFQRHHELTAYQRGHADAMEQGLSQILARLDRLENITIREVVAFLALVKQERELAMTVKQSTTDLITAFTDLSTKVSDLEALIQQADDTDDEAAKADLLSQIKAKAAEISSHLPTVATTATAAAQADADPQATVSAA